MDKLKMHSPDITQQNIDKLLELLPNCKTEKQDDNGELIIGVDFDLLKQELSKSIVEGPKERYQLNWPGKKEALLTANAPIAKTLRPCREESVDFDTTENLFIEGDNLDALKLLQETYLGKVKMIYIDPPYNTGKDFIYQDDFSKAEDDYLQESGQKDGEGNRFIANTDSNGRFHSDWLSMIYSRLKLARNLLKGDGVVFISIDDNEVHNLTSICHDIFGSENYIAKIVHKNNALKNQSKFIGVSTEYALAFAKDMTLLKKKADWKERKLGADEVCKFIRKELNKGKNDDEVLELVKELYARPKYSHLSRWNKIDSNGVFMDDNLSREGGKKNYTINNPVSGDPCPIPPRGWAKSYEELLMLQEKGLIWYGDGTTPPRLKSYLTPDSESVPDNYKYFDSSKDKKLIDELFGKRLFEYPKSLDLIANFIEISTSKKDVVVDFFAGSATTAHAVFKSNAEDEGRRKFIMVQLPEVCDEKSEAFKSGYKTIADISKERMRRAGQKIKEENPEVTNLDTGFRVLKIDSSNMNEVHYTPDTVSKDDLFNQVEHIKTDRSSEDLLFQVMLDWGVGLSLPIRKETIEGKEVYFVNDDDLVACFDKGIDEVLIKTLAAKKPLRVVFRDDGFGTGNDSDSVKINVEQIFKQLAPATDIKAI